MKFYILVGAKGFEPSTPCSQSRCANQTALRPDICFLVELGGLEPPAFSVRRKRAPSALQPHLAVFIVSAPLVACQVRCLVIWYIVAPEDEN